MTKEIRWTTIIPWNATYNRMIWTPYVFGSLRYKLSMYTAACGHTNLPTHSWNWKRLRYQNYDDVCRGQIQLLKLYWTYFLKRNETQFEFLEWKYSESFNRQQKRSNHQKTSTLSENRFVKPKRKNEIWRLFSQTDQLWTMSHSIAGID